MYISDFFVRMMSRVNGWFGEAKCANMPSEAECDGPTQLEVQATATASITATGANGDTWTLAIDPGTGAVTVATYSEQTSDSAEDIAAGLVAAIGSGYTATDNLDGTFTVTAPSGTGAGGNAYTGTLTSSGSGTATLSAFAGGKDAVN